jgi:hypothetical protein
MLWMSVRLGIKFDFAGGLSPENFEGSVMGAAANFQGVKY